MSGNYKIRDFGYFKTKMPSTCYTLKEYVPNVTLEHCKINTFEYTTSAGCKEIHYDGEQVYSNPAYYEEKTKNIEGKGTIKIIYMEFKTEKDHHLTENHIKSISSNSAEHYCNNNIHIVIDSHSPSDPYDTPRNAYKCHEIQSCSEDLRQYQKKALDNIELNHDKILTNIKDEKKLINIAKNDENYWVRRDAVGMIGDNHILKDIAMSDEKLSVRSAAVENISDESILKELVKNLNNPTLSRDAVKNPNLKDESFLKDIAKHNPNYMIRHEAVRKISSKSLLNILWKIDYKIFWSNKQ